MGFTGRPRAYLDPGAWATVQMDPSSSEPVRPTLGLTREADGKVTITTDSTLQVADTVTGTYSNLPGKSVTVDPKTAGSQKFYRGTKP